MRGKPISDRYAKALFQAVDGPAKLREVKTEASNLIELLARVPELKLLRNKGLKADKKALVLKVLQDERLMGKELSSFSKLMLENGRIEYFSDALGAFVERVDEFEGVLKVEVVSARTLSSSYSESIDQTLKNVLGRSPSLSKSLDPEILGGIKLKFADAVLDMSLKRELEALRKNLA